MGITAKLRGLFVHGIADFLEQPESSRIDFSLCHGILQGAIGFVGVVAIMKTALAQIGGKFNKTLFDISETQVMQSKHLYTRTVDQMAVRVQVIETCMGGGVFAGIEHG